MKQLMSIFKNWTMWISGLKASTECLTLRVKIDQHQAYHQNMSEPLEQSVTTAFQNTKTENELRHNTGRLESRGSIPSNFWEKMISM
jgi:hypothetical protein